MIEKIKMNSEFIEVKSIASWEHGVSADNNRQYLKVNLKNGNSVTSFDTKTFKPSVAAGILHTRGISGVCPKCGELNNDDWPLKIGSDVLNGGCLECWEEMDNG